MSASPPPVPTVVIDSNVVFDWLVFDNPGCAPLAKAIESGAVRWVVTQTLRDELAHVLGRGGLSAWAPDEVRLWATWDRFAHQVEAKTPGLALRMRCSDPDDQKFIELALDEADWLISRDRAVLKLAKRASKFGVQIVTPESWSALQTCATDRCAK